MAHRRCRDRGSLARGLCRLSSSDCRGPAPLLEPAPRPREVAQILGDQAALHADASAEERLVALAERCPALHKLGQILARDRRLALELRLHLQRLESLPPVTPLDSIEQTLTSELGPLESLGVKLDPPALAEASVAVVVPFRYTANGRDDLPERGVFKILKPGIEERLALELDLLQDVGELLDDRCVAFGIPQLAYREVFDQVREKLATEVDLKGEQRHLVQAAETYASGAGGLDSTALPVLFRTGHGHGADRRPQGDRTGGSQPR